MAAKRPCCVVVDVETTGLSPNKGDRIIEVGAVKIEGGQFVEEFCSLVDAGRRISPYARQVHGITDEMLIDQPQPEDLFPKFRDFIQDSVLVGHNARFDINFLRHEFQRLGLRLGNRYLCTLEMSRRHYPQLPNHKLDTVCSLLLGGNDRGVRRHRALDDARLTARIWLKMTTHG